MTSLTRNRLINIGGIITAGLMIIIELSYKPESSHLIVQITLLILFILSFFMNERKYRRNDNAGDK